MDFLWDEFQQSTLVATLLQGFRRKTQVLDASKVLFKLYSVYLKDNGRKLLTFSLAHALNQARPNKLWFQWECRISML